MSSLPTLTDRTFDPTIATGRWLVEFWSPDCRPCQIVSPVLTDLQERFRGQVNFASVNVDTELATALRQRVMGVPTVMLYLDGRPVDVLYSSRPPHVYAERLARLAERVPVPVG
ncbi:thioredoxin family protein [Deinococcus sonorensis]|uniref:Thioredoxin family protein n=1 Tax=Deinococcus sonorensis TaxID=309891 RepID=A0ABV8Y891_9DEIO